MLLLVVMFCCCVRRNRLDEHRSRVVQHLKETVDNAPREHFDTPPQPVPDEDQFAVDLWLQDHLYRSITRSDSRIKT